MLFRPIPLIQLNRYLKLYNKQLKTVEKKLFFFENFKLIYSQNSRYF